MKLISKVFTRSSGLLLAIALPFTLLTSCWKKHNVTSVDNGNVEKVAAKTPRVLVKSEKDICGCYIATDISNFPVAKMNLDAPNSVFKKHYLYVNHNEELGDPGRELISVRVIETGDKGKEDQSVLRAIYADVFDFDFNKGQIKVTKTIKENAKLVFSSVNLNRGFRKILTDEPEKYSVVFESATQLLVKKENKDQQILILNNEDVKGVGIPDGTIFYKADSKKACIELVNQVDYLKRNPKILSGLEEKAFSFNKLAAELSEIQDDTKE